MIVIHILNYNTSTIFVNPPLRLLSNGLTRVQDLMYSRDENEVAITRVPGASGFFAQRDSFKEARENLREVIIPFLLGSFYIRSFQ